MTRKKKDPKVQLLEDRYQQQYERFERAEARLRRAAHAWEHEGRAMKGILKRLCDAEVERDNRFLTLGPRRLPAVREGDNGGLK